MPVYMIERTFADQLDLTSEDVREIDEINGDDVTLALLIPERGPPAHLLPLRGAVRGRDRGRG